MIKELQSASEVSENKQHTHCRTLPPWAVLWLECNLWSMHVEHQTKIKQSRFDFGTIWNRSDQTQLCLKSRHLYEYEWKDVISALTLHLADACYPVTKWCSGKACPVKLNTIRQLNDIINNLQFVLWWSSHFLVSSYHYVLSTLHYRLQSKLLHNTYRDIN